jgi:hypothetical protein
MKGAVRAADREGPLGRGDQLLSEPSVVYTESKLSCTRGLRSHWAYYLVIFAFPAPV